MYSDRHADLIDIGTQISVRRLRDNVDAWLYSVYKKFYLHGLTGSALRPRAHSEGGAVPERSCWTLNQSTFRISVVSASLYMCTKHSQDTLRLRSHNLRIS